MKIEIFSLLLTSSFAAWFDGPKCTYQSQSYVLMAGDRTWINWPGIEYDSWIGCWSDEYSCGSTRYEGSITKYWKGWFTDKIYNETFTYYSERKTCTADTACELFAGGENECEYAAYTWEKWRPRSCNETAEFNAITEEYDTKLYFTCCNDPNYCNRDVDYSSSSLGCEENSDFSQYMVDLNTCWNDYKYDFMKDLLCDDERGDILTYSEQCLEEDGSWKTSARSDTRNCTYQVQCAPELQELLTSFGSCACTSAASNGYTGEFIGSAMEANWGRWCPNIEIECATDGLVKLLRKYYYVRYKFRVALARSALSDAIKRRIRQRIAARLNIVIDRISIDDEDADDSTTTTRRRLADSTDLSITVDSDDEETQEYFDEQIKELLDDIQADIANETGSTVEQTGTGETGEGEDELTGEYTGSVSNANSYYIMFAVIVAILFSVYSN